MNDDLFKRLAEDVARDVPELRGIMDQVKAGTLSESEGLQQMVAACLKNPETARLLMQTSQKALAPLRDREPGRLAVQPGDMVFNSGVGLPQLHPLAQAAIIERLQFDGDIPEWRTGPLGAEGTPALSVATAARNPAAIGQMLRQASADMSNQIGAFQQGLLAQHEQALVRLDPERRMALIEEIQETDHPAYQRGQVPAPAETPLPSGEMLALMPRNEQQQNTWQFLSTTQGRRSALQTLEDLLKTGLQKEGFKPTVRPASSDEDENSTLVASHTWTIGIDGPRAMQANFSPLDTAAGSLLRGLLDGWDHWGGPVTLEVFQVMAGAREAGWGARLYVPKE